MPELYAGNGGVSLVAVDQAATALVSGREVGVGDLPRSLRRATLCLCSFKVWAAGYAVVHPRPRLQQRS